MPWVAIPREVRGFHPDHGYDGGHGRNGYGPCPLCHASCLSERRIGHVDGQEPRSGSEM